MFSRKPPTQHNKCTTTHEISVDWKPPPGYNHCSMSPNLFYSWTDWADDVLQLREHGINICMGMNVCKSLSHERPVAGVIDCLVIETSGFPLHLLASRRNFQFSSAYPDSCSSTAEQSFTHFAMSQWAEINTVWDSETAISSVMDPECLAVITPQYPWHMNWLPASSRALRINLFYSEQRQHYDFDGVCAHMLYISRFSKFDKGASTLVACTKSAVNITRTRTFVSQRIAVSILSWQTDDGWFALKPSLPACKAKTFQCVWREILK